MPRENTYLIRGTLSKMAKPGVHDVGITSARRVIPGSGRDAALGEAQVKGDDAVKIVLDNGFVLWSRADDLIRERGRKSQGRDGAEAWEIDARPRDQGTVQGASRGWLGLGIRVLEFFGVDLGEETAAKLGRTLEAKLLKGNDPGLYRCDLSGPFKLKAVPEGEEPPADRGPLLVFLHGTASSCQGSFGKLWEPGSSARDAARKSMAETYGERAYAWEHRSLTHSPIQNALELVEHLPKGAELDLVSHSRGGLVGELLCLGGRDRDGDPLKGHFAEILFQADRTVAEQLGLSPLHPDAAKERDSAYGADRKALAKLVKRLDDKAIKVRRFVRVACPARGTTLASGRLDRWLSVLNYFMPEGLADDLLDFLLAVVKERTDPRTLPGLEAMMPGSALTRLLQHPDLVTDADLTVIAGDLERGDSLWSQIKLFATDWFYGSDHDLVVNTGSMYGGLRRPEAGARFLFDQGAKVNHFSYFENDKSVRWLLAGLTRAEGANAGFQPLVEAKPEAPRWRDAVRRSRAITAPRPLAVVLPGTMGSALNVVGEEVWLSYWALFKGGLGRLRMGRPEIAPTDLLDDFYGPLLEFLTRSHRVEIFPYDWRLSVRDAASRLAERLETWLPDCERQNQPVHLVAHSMGGLVVRSMIADGGRGAAVWRRILNLPNSRFMMLGTPNLGSHEAVRWLTGCNPTEAKLSLLDITHGTNEIVDIVREYPGLLELLPFDDEALAFGQQTRWKDLKQQVSGRWPVADADTLAKARGTWEFLKDAAPDPAHMVYVAGCQDATVVDYRVTDYDEDYLIGRKRLEFVATREGDGTVPWRSGLMKDVATWYVEDTAHDELCANGRAFAGYLDLLMTGTTTRLPAAPPGKRRDAGATETFILPAQPPSDGIPPDLRGFGFGPSRPSKDRGQASGVPVIQVEICHGDLAYAKYPVVVGHYQGDTVVSAEKALDQRLDHALTRRLDLGLYPGAHGTHTLFFNAKPDGKPGGAVVVGLGQVGELSPGLLTTALRDAMLDFALRVALWPDDRFGPADHPRSAALSCLLIGTSAGGVSIRDSLEAILRAATAANARLVKVQLENKVVIDRLEILELMQDAAIGAAKSLEDLLSDGQIAMDVTWPEHVVKAGEGGQRRVRCEETGGWWQRLEIVKDKDSGMLRFIATTDRARAEVTLATGQLPLADGFIRQASQSPAANAEVAKTLFEMLLPNRLKELAPRQGDLVLLVDSLSARYPWELLEDRWSQSRRPPAVAAGLVRQLKTPRYRPHPGHASAPTAYIVGNPDLSGTPDFSDLPGARNEAQKVAAVLGSKGYRAMECIDEKADAIMSGLHKDAWRILHLAGHGVHEYPLSPVAGEREPIASGMVIGHETFLTPGDVEQMRWVPELVFINCCHLAKTQAAREPRHNLLAANLAVQFIEMGVKAVVAAGWAVDDSAAETFAESFYTHLLAGQAFGEAVRMAREAIWVRFPNVNTWGAYQCYGDPSYRLHSDGSDAARVYDSNYHDPVELAADLNNLVQKIRMEISEKGEDEEVLSGLRTAIGARLKGIPNTARAAWLARADLAAALGFAWGEAGAYAEAVEWLEKALRANVGECPVRTLEQCANFNVRLAGQQWQQLRGAPPGAATDDVRRPLIARIETAIAELALIAERGPTDERYSLLGSACKRLAWLRTEPALRLEALVNMAGYYARAYELGKQSDPYPFTNWATAKLIADSIEPDQDQAWRDTLEDDCRRMGQIAQERDAKRPKIWDALGVADCELVRLLARPDARRAALIASSEDIAEIYREALRRGASPRERASVLENLDFVIALSGKLPKRMGEALAMLRAAL